MNYSWLCTVLFALSIHFLWRFHGPWPPAVSRDPIVQIGHCLTPSHMQAQGNNKLHDTYHRSLPQRVLKPVARGVMGPLHLPWQKPCENFFWLPYLAIFGNLPVFNHLCYPPASQWMISCVKLICLSVSIFPKMIIDLSVSVSSIPSKLSHGFGDWTVVKTSLSTSTTSELILLGRPFSISSGAGDFVLVRNWYN